MITARWRGHAIEYTGGSWLYRDTGRPVSGDPERRCGRCGEPNTAEGHDPCIARLPHVINACCGHGEDREAYVMFDSRRRLSGDAALVWMGIRTRCRLRGNTHP